MTRQEAFAAGPLALCDHEIARCGEYQGPDGIGALMGQADWMAEKEIVQTDRYQSFLAKKRRFHKPSGFSETAPAFLFPFQRHILEWALRLGKAAIFAECGLGKTPMQLAWAQAVAAHTGMPVLILAPLAVSAQTIREGAKFGINVHGARSQSDVDPGINITNYEMLSHFDPHSFAGVVLDESSILKSYTGKIRNHVIESFAATPFRLACTATPSPNDHMELGNHAEFLGVMTRTAMLATYFNHDGGETSKWRLKGHAVNPFWRFISSFGIMIRKPSDLGYDDTGWDLPPLRHHMHTVETEAQQGMLFPVAARDLPERREARKVSVDDRVELVAQMANGSKSQWLVWGDHNIETESARQAILGSVEVKGPDSHEHKESSMLGFADGKIRVLVTKPKIAGFGMNWQNCNQMAFLGLSDSFESLYQSERRCWRFGQKNPVDVHIVTSDRDENVVENIERKRKQAEEMAESMIRNMKETHEI